MDLHLTEVNSIQAWGFVLDCLEVDKTNWPTGWPNPGSPGGHPLASVGGPLLTEPAHMRPTDWLQMSKS